MDPATLSLIATLGSTAFGALAGGGGGDVPVEQRGLMTSQRGLVDAQHRSTDIDNALHSLKLSRTRAQDPLWRALQHMAFSRLPIYAQQGFDFSSMMNPIQEDPAFTGPSDSRLPGARVRPDGMAPGNPAVARRTV